MVKHLSLFFIGLILWSCGESPEKKDGAIARVGDNYLYIKDIQDLIEEETAPEDSIQIVSNYINRWASKYILMEAADKNIGGDSKVELDKLVEQYKMDLYTNLYLEKLVAKSLDTTVTEEEIKNLYNDTKDYFRLNSKLVKLRFLVLQQDHPKYESIRSKFLSFSKKDQAYLESIGIQLKQFALNDDVWVEANTLYKKFPFLTPENAAEYLISGKTTQSKDSLYAYLIKVNQVLDKGEISPFEYQKNTIKDIILNKRKLELVKQFEKEITENAIKNEKFEIYK
jgi:hypothetical protein